jgi:PAS domain-containing protein
VLCWYFGLAQVNIEPIIWTLAGLALVQLAISSQTHRASTPAHFQRLALSSQMIGTVLMGVGWHFFGGLQQPLFPLFIVLPLVPAALVMGFWQQQTATLGLLAVLVSGVLMSPDTNSFIEERYGIRIASGHLLPDWMPRSTTAFPDVSTSPAYDLVLMITVGVIGVAVSTAARAVVGVCRRTAGRAAALESELERLQQLSEQIVTHSPAAMVRVASGTGRIVNASERFTRAFDVSDPQGRFLLDAIAFAYPAVIRRLMTTGGEEVQGATVRGRDAVVRVRAEVVGSGTSQVATLNIESCDEICWRGAVDAMDEPVFAVNSHGCVAFLNRAALAVFGADAEGVPATNLFGTQAARWWDIAPLESARRLLDRGEHRYLASIRRERIAASIGELSFVHLHERASAVATA